MLFTLVWGLIDAEKHGWGHFTPFAWLITVTVLLALFIAWETREERIRHPHIPLSLFRSPQFSSGVAMAVSTFIGLYAVLFFVTLYMQRVHGYTASETGVRLLALTGVMGVSAFAGSKVVARFGPPLPLLVGGLLSAAGLIGLSRLGPDTSFSAIWPYLALIGLGFFVQLRPDSRARSSVEHLPVTAGWPAVLQSTAVQIGGLLGLSILGSVIVSRVSSTLPHKLRQAGVPSLSRRSAQWRRSWHRSGGSSPSPEVCRRAPPTRSPRSSQLAFTAGLDTAWRSRPRSSASPESLRLWCAR